MRIRDFLYGALVITLCLLIGVGVSQMGRSTAADSILPDIASVPTSEPTAGTEPVDLPVVVPEANTVLNRVLYIGELRGCQLREDARIPNGDYFCCPDLTVFNLEGKTLSDLQFKDKTLNQLLAHQEYSCVVLSLGLNEAGYPMERLKQGFDAVIDKLVRTQPQAKIVIQGVLTVGRKKAEQSPHTSPEQLAKLNDMLRELSGSYRVNFLNPNDCFCDEEGYLPDTLSGNGCYMYSEYNRQWSQWLCDRVEEMER